MRTPNIPDPVLDARELDLMKKLAADYRTFTTPGRMSKALIAASHQLSKLAPEKLASLIRAATDTAAEAAVVQKALEYADAWATIGSTNIANRSFHGDTELNASFWHAETVRALRCELLAEHLGADTAALDDRAALRFYREIASANRERRRDGAPTQGLAFAIDPADYGV